MRSLLPRGCLAIQQQVCYDICVGRKGLRRTPRNAYRSEVMYMSDFEMLSIFLMILSLVVKLLKKDN